MTHCGKSCCLKGAILTGATVLTLAGCGSVRSDFYPDRGVQTFSPSAISMLSSEESIEVGRLYQLRNRVLDGPPLTADETSELARLHAKMRIRGLLDGDSEETRVSVARINTALTHYYREVETSQYAHDGLPANCIAMSGGGIRSAAFSLGALTALYRIDVLKGTDVYSSVSGGGYTLAWLYSNLSQDNVTLDDLFDRQRIWPRTPPAKFNPSFISLSTAAVGMVLAVPIDAAGGISKVLPHYFDSSIAVFDKYKLDIERAFGIPRNAPLRTQQRKGLPIWNVAAFPVNADFWSRPRSTLAEAFVPASLDEVLLEVSPIRIGNDGLGFNSVRPRGLDDLSDVVALSGAAIDQPFVDGSFIWTSAGYRLGGTMRLTVPRVPWDAGTSAAGNIRSALVYATDGGAAENLGVFPLVKRLCRSIWIIDAEQDPHWIFESYEVVRQRLLREHQIRMQVPDLELIAAANRAPCRPRSDGVCLPAPLDTCQKLPFSQDCYQSRRQATSIFRGSVGPIPIIEGDSVVDKHLSVFYVKLGIHELHMDTYSPAVAQYFASCTASAPCYFPHDPTLDQIYTAEQFLAYVFLGRDSILRHFPSAMHSK